MKRQLSKNFKLIGEQASFEDTTGKLKPKFWSQAFHFIFRIFSLKQVADLHAADNIAVSIRFKSPIICCNKSCHEEVTAAYRTNDSFQFTTCTNADLTFFKPTFSQVIAAQSPFFKTTTEIFKGECSLKTSNPLWLLI